MTGATPGPERERLIAAFKARELKYLVNVAVLTTGFDAPHVDVIAILRPTESVGLYQQIVGRGLRLSPGKTDCLILDYAGNPGNSTPRRSPRHARTARVSRCRSSVPSAVLPIPSGASATVRS